MFGNKLRYRKFEWSIGATFDNGETTTIDGKSINHLYDDEWALFIKLFETIKDAGFNVELYEREGRTKIV